MSHMPGANDFPLDDSRQGIDKRRAARFAAAGIAVLVAAVFMAQNNDRVELDFLMLSVTTRLWVGMFVTLVLGALLGQGLEALWARRRRRDGRS
jgi:uncharacterized integral membrane protein